MQNGNEFSLSGPENPETTRIGWPTAPLTRRVGGPTSNPAITTKSPPLELAHRRALQSHGQSARLRMEASGSGHKPDLSGLLEAATPLAYGQSHRWGEGGLSRLKEEQHNCPGPAFTKASWNLGFILATRPQPSPRRGDAQGHQPPWLGLRIGCSVGGPRRAPGQPRSALHTGSVATASPAQAACVRTADGCQDARAKAVLMGLQHRALDHPATLLDRHCPSRGQQGNSEFRQNATNHVKKVKSYWGGCWDICFFLCFLLYWPAQKFLACVQTAVTGRKCRVSAKRDANQLLSPHPR